MKCLLNDIEKSDFFDAVNEKKIRWCGPFSVWTKDGFYFIPDDLDTDTNILHGDIFQTKASVDYHQRRGFLNVSGGFKKDKNDSYWEFVEEKDKLAKAAAMTALVRPAGAIKTMDDWTDALRYSMQEAFKEGAAVWKGDVFIGVDKAAPKSCNCDMTQLMKTGCKCGSIKAVI